MLTCTFPFCVCVCVCVCGGRSGGRCVGKSFPRQSCQTLGQLKRLISESVENAEKEDQTVVFNGRELTDDSMALAECLPGRFMKQRERERERE